MGKYYMVSILPSLERWRCAWHDYYSMPIQARITNICSEFGLRTKNWCTCINKAKPNSSIDPWRMLLNAQLESEKRVLLRVSYCSASARIDKSLLCTVWGGRVEAIINLTRSQILPFAGIAGRRKSREPESSKRDQFCAYQMRLSATAGDVRTLTL